jgi:hypothetical protein
MDAVAALYADDHPEVSEAIVASLSKAIFNGGVIAPAGPVQRTLARLSYRMLRWTTKTDKRTDETGCEATVFRNPVLERCGHPYARALLASSRIETASLVEGGDPMNGNYMLIAPEIRGKGRLWDRLLLDSVQGKDVRLRLALETRATYDAAKRWLERQEPVRLKGLAAGTGLSMILAYDRLVRDGYNPNLITAVITDREEANIDKANRLLGKIATTRENRRVLGRGCGISAETEDIFAETETGKADTARFDVVTAVGILEYFQGFSYATTEERLKLAPPAAAATAQDLARILHQMTSDRGCLIVNTYRDDPSTRILELFGRRFVYRNRENLRALLASVNFRPARLVGSGNIYDVEVYELNPAV